MVISQKKRNQNTEYKNLNSSTIKTKTNRTENKKLNASGIKTKNTEYRKFNSVSIKNH